MSRRWHHHYLGKSETLNGEERQVALCGAVYARCSTEVVDVSCPDCHRKLDKQRLKDRNPDEPALTMVQDKDAKGSFRHNGGWRALVDGAHVAFLGYEDHAWRIYRLRLGEDQPLVGYPVNLDGTSGERNSFFRVRAAEFKSKEAALLAVADLRAAGHLPSYGEMLAAAVAYQARTKAYQEQRRAEEAAAEKERSDTLEALNEILARETLSNFQRQGLMTAIARFAHVDES